MQRFARPPPAEGAASARGPAPAKRASVPACRNCRRPVREPLPRELGPVLESLDKQFGPLTFSLTPPPERLSEDAPEPAGVERLAALLIQEALRARGSDLHFEPGTRGVRVRFRVDG